MDLKQLKEKVNKKAIEAGCAVFAGASMVANTAFAETVTGGVDVQWPWTKFFAALAAEFTGPLPMTLGMFGIVGASFALFTGHAGGASQKFIVLIFAISTALFAPNFMEAISDSAAGLTIFGLE